MASILLSNLPRLHDLRSHARFGGIYALTGELFMLMVAHASFDLVALALIYWNLEAPVAHLFFK